MSDELTAKMSRAGKKLRAKMVGKGSAPDTRTATQHRSVRLGKEIRSAVANRGSDDAGRRRMNKEAPIASPAPAVTQERGRQLSAPMVGKVVSPTDVAPPMTDKRIPEQQLSAPMKGTERMAQRQSRVEAQRAGSHVKRVTGGSVEVIKRASGTGATSTASRGRVGGRGTRASVSREGAPSGSTAWRRSMTDIDGRPVLQKGGLHKFMSYSAKQDAPLPDKFLFDYLCSFVEEAYEHEKREPEHKHTTHFLSGSLPEYFARLIMGELVQCMPKNKNLMRAAKKYKVTQDVIARLLVAKGIIKPKSDTMWTDSDSARAMGASLLAESEPMAYSQEHSWMQGAPYAVGLNMRKAAPDNVANQIVDNSIDPASALRIRKSVELRDLWGQGDQAVVANVADDCPVHGGRDMSKSMNLHNVMTPCTCHGESRAYG